jgi:hypothetical protein
LTEFPWVVHVLLVWLLPVLPGQDLAQHLAIARVLADYKEAGLPFEEVYLLPERFQGYHAVHLLLASLGRLTSVETGARVVLTLYVLGMIASFRYLRRVVHEQPADRRTGDPWGAVLAIPLIWSPVALLGLLPFLATIPIFFGATALYLRVVQSDVGHPGLAAIRARLMLFCSALASLHTAAAAFFVLFGTLHVVLNRSRRALQAWIHTIVSVTIVTLAWILWNPETITVGPRTDWREAIDRALGLEFVNEILGIVWYDPVVTLGYVLATCLGPYRWTGLIVNGVVIGVAAVLLNSSRRKHAGAIRFGTDGARRTFLAFALASCLVPWGLHYPDELTFVNLRMMTLALGLLLVLLPPALLPQLPVFCCRP